MNQVYTDLESKNKGRPKEKATEAVKFLEKVSWFEEDNEEVVGIANAISATQMAELEALEASRKMKPVEIEFRINELKKII